MVSELNTPAGLKNRTKRSLKTGVWRVLDQVVGRYVTDKFKQFAPNSAGTYRARAELTVQSAKQIFPLIAHFLRVVDGREDASKVVEAREFCADEESKKRAARLKAEFDARGSDKGGHGYHYIYGFMLKEDSAAHILEIGLGTNREDVVSNMGRNGKPGASLRAFRDFCPNASVYGADVDKRILFSEDRIKTFFVDQTDLTSFTALRSNVGTGFDLIIDDGLHTPSANIATLSFALNELKDGGWFVVEDIAYSSLPIWQAIAMMLPEKYAHHLIAVEGGIAFAVQKMGPS
jgi:hypothetical protein